MTQNMVSGELPAAAGEFTVYAGGGWYVMTANSAGGIEGRALPVAVEVAAVRTEIFFDDLRRAARYSRAEAVRACHMARGAGVPAWVVRHPASIEA